MPLGSVPWWCVVWHVVFGCLFNRRRNGVGAGGLKGQQKIARSPQKRTPKNSMPHGDTLPRIRPTPGRTAQVSIVSPLSTPDSKKTKREPRIVTLTFVCPQHADILISRIDLHFGSSSGSLI